MKKTLTIALIGLGLSACAGSVMTVDGVTFDVEDVPVETDAPLVDSDVFRNALNWLIANQVVMSAAEDELGIVLPEGDVEQLAEALLAGADGLDPSLINLGYSRIQARIGPSGLLWPELQSNLPEGVSPIQWANDLLFAADVDVDVRFGEWRVSPSPGVYQP